MDRGQGINRKKEGKKEEKRKIRLREQ